MNTLCDNCNVKPATTACGGLCGSTFYCGQECASLHYIGGHHEECSVLISKIIIDMSRPEFERRGFYKASVRKMESIYKNDIFGWFAIQIYMHSPFINKILFAVKGDWTKFNNKFEDIYKSHARIAKYAVQSNPYDKFRTFFLDMLVVWQSGARRLGASKGKKILSQQELLAAYPKLTPYFKMSNAQFTFAFASHIQHAITSIPKTSLHLYVWRGYSVLNIPDTLTIDIDRLQVGQQFTTWGFTSVAIDSRVSAAFLKENPSPSCCLLRVLIPKNNNVFLISGEADDPNYSDSAFVTHGQTEILLAAGTIVQVIQKQTPIMVPRGMNKKHQLKPLYTKWADVVVVGRKKIKTFNL